MSIAWSPGAAFPMTAATGARRAEPSWFPKALAKLVRGKLSAAFQKRRPDLVRPEAAWSKPWIVHCTA
jgi:hypothetical protein